MSNVLSFTGACGRDAELKTTPQVEVGDVWVGYGRNKFDIIEVTPDYIYALPVEWKKVVYRAKWKIPLSDFLANFELTIGE